MVVKLVPILHSSAVNFGDHCGRGVLREVALLTPTGVDPSSRMPISRANCCWP